MLIVELDGTLVDQFPPGIPCSGSYAFDLKAHLLGASATALPGDDVYCQYWHRDPADASQTGLSDALAVQVLP